MRGHGGDPKSIAYCNFLNLNYVSCSPFRIPIARLAAAQSEINQNHKIFNIQFLSVCKRSALFLVTSFLIKHKPISLHLDFIVPTLPFYKNIFI